MVLAETGHRMPFPANELAERNDFGAAPMSVVRWLCQIGMTFSDAILRLAVEAGRVDILRFALAHTGTGTLQMRSAHIEAAAARGQWPVVVWAVRHAIAFNRKRVAEIVEMAGRRFAYEEQRGELLTLLGASSARTKRAQTDCAAIPKRHKSKR